SLAQLRKRSAEDNDLLQLEQALEDGAGIADAELYVNLAMAKECEDIGQYHRAFSHYTRGKGVQKRARGYDGSSDRALFAAIEQAFDTAAPQGAAGYDSDE